MTKALATLHKRHAQRSLRYAGLIVACAYGSVRRLQSWPGNSIQDNPTHKTEATVSSSPTQIKTRDGQREGSNLSPGSEQKIERSVAPFYNDKVVSRDMYISGVHAAPQWCAGTRCRSRVLSY